VPKSHVKGLFIKIFNLNAKRPRCNVITSLVAKVAVQNFKSFINKLHKIHYLANFFAVRFG
jgi:hypothetical protein